MARIRRRVRSSPDGESERRSAPVRTQSYASSPAPAELRLVLQLPSQTNSPGKRLEFALNKTVVIVGRYGDNDVIIDPPSVSRRHARLTIGPDRQSFLVEDMGSSNGTLRWGIGSGQ